MAAIQAGVPPEMLDGKSRCFGGCGLEVSRGGGECEPCLRRRLQREHFGAIQFALETIPPTLRWAAFRPHQGRANGRLLTEWVRDPSAIQQAQEWAAVPRQSGMLTLVGKSGAGKSTLAAAVMRELMRPGVLFETPYASRLHARNARFEHAFHIVGERARTSLDVPLVCLEVARNASILVLDEVGRGLDTFKLIFGMVAERHAMSRTTVMTTPFATSEEMFAATGDGALARRVFGDATVIQVGS
jgi:hypothetical protein